MVGKYETGSCRAPLLISIFTGTRIKNHAAINARCSNLIKPCVRSLQLGEEEERGGGPVECYFDRVFYPRARRKGSLTLELESSFSDGRLN